MVFADRSETMRLGVRALFDKNCVNVEVTDVATRSELMKEIQKTDYDLVLVDPLLCSVNAEALLRQIRTVAPQVNMLVYTELDELRFGLKAMRCGVKGYVMKTEPADELLIAVNKVSAGKVHMSDALAEAVAMNIWEGKEATLHELLSEREWVVFSMLVGGASVTSIATTLNLSVKTISTHKARAMVKLRCRNFSEMIQYAIEQKLTTKGNVVSLLN